MNLERPGDAELTAAAPEEPSTGAPSGPGEDDDNVAVEVLVDGVQAVSPRSNLKKSSSKRRLTGVSFSEQRPMVEVFEIEEGHKFRKTPSLAKLKAMAGRWSDPFALSSSRKRIRVDEMEEAEETKAPEPSASPVDAPAPTAASAACDPSAMTEQQIEAKFEEVALEAWVKLANSGQAFKVEHMVPDLKASGLFDAIKAKHGAVRKWFTIHPELFGLSADGFISRKGYNEEFRVKVKETLEAAPKQTMKLHQLTTDLKSQVSENGFRKAMKGYDTLVNYLAAHSNDFLLSKDKMFVTIRRDVP